MQDLVHDVDIEDIFLDVEDLVLDLVIDAEDLDRLDGLVLEVPDTEDVVHALEDVASDMKDLVLHVDIEDLVLVHDVEDLVFDLDVKYLESSRFQTSRTTFKLSKAWSPTFTTSS